ncbi:acetolactate synthase, partial [Trifolium medium]|nr:acetolactate synthase [Trifolium medium]
ESWKNELNAQKLKFPLGFKTCEDAISPQYAIKVLDELTNGEAIISTGIGQHQMWASAGLDAMGFGLPAAIGVVVANPDAIVVDIDGD